ncbi:uracil-DNA glycosylase-like protein [Dipodascopsis uninucleata]
MNASAAKRKAELIGEAGSKKIKPFASYFIKSASSKISTSTNSNSLKSTDSGNKDDKKLNSDKQLTPAKGSSPAFIVNGIKTAGEPFDKAQWVDTLSGEERDLLRLEIDTMGESWLAVLKDEIRKPYFLNLKRFLVKEARAGTTILPPSGDVYSWSRLTPLDKVRVVILGQDPYHNIGQAHGLAFSVKPPTAIPPSLRNIYATIKKDYPDFVIPKHGDLTKWAERGVLLLNTCLTVKAHNANSHAQKGWEQFTERVIQVVTERCKSGVCFLAWGTPAGKRVAKVNENVHAVFRAVHPSPLSASRGFFECQHFKKANEWLAKRYGEEGIIDWKL